MNKELISVKENIFVILCFVIAVGIRIFLLLSGTIPVTDDFRYYEASMISGYAKEPVMTSGIAFAYVRSLSKVLMFTGNRLNVAAGYHIVLQAAVFLFLFLGCYFLFGKIAAFIEILSLAFTPWMISSLFLVSPENYYLFGWSFIFLLIGIFAKKTREQGWYRSSKDECYLMLLGFLTGVVCIWHYMGFLLILLMVYAVITNLFSMIEKRKIWKTAYAMDSLLTDEADEREEVMPVASLVMTLIAGIFWGGFCTLMKYTGVTGNFIKEQFLWWQERAFTIENGCWQDLSIKLLAWIIVTMFAGVGMQTVVAIFYNKRNKEDIMQEAAAMEDKVEERAEDKKDENKKVKYIENPLPLPKKHEKRTLDFKLDQKKDDFDFEISPDDDFDIQ
ncbi:MAG: hypothetical protein ACI4ED_06415 [Suilimivivens sp.]